MPRGRRVARMFRAANCGAFVAVAAALLSAGASQAAELATRSATLAAAPVPVANALRANVLIETAFEDGRRSVAAGVILTMRDGATRIGTARHVVQPDFVRGTTVFRQPTLTVVGIDGARAPGTVEWIAPHGIDLAIVSAPLAGADLRPACRIHDVTTKADAAVFAIGNPEGTGWAHASGALMQVREQRQESQDFQVLQSRLALGSGYSGGGLYDEGGRLIGIHSMAAAPLGDPRVAGGIALSTSLATLIELAPERFGLGSNYTASCASRHESVAR